MPGVELWRDFNIHNYFSVFGFDMNTVKEGFSSSSFFHLAWKLINIINHEEHILRMGHLFFKGIFMIYFYEERELNPFFLLY